MASLQKDIRNLIETARSQVAQTVNAGLALLYWNIGKRISQDILAGKRGEYGGRILQTLSAKLVRDYGQGFSEKGLRHMMRFAEVFPDEKIVSTLWRQLSWSHFRTLIYSDDRLKRDFYAELCRLEGWSVRMLGKKIGGMLCKALEKRLHDAIRTAREHLNPPEPPTVSGPSMPS